MITRINADLLSLLALGATTVSAWTSSEAGVQNGCYWDVPGVGSFNTHFNGDWNLHPYEAIEEIISSTYTVAAGNSPLARRFDMVNIGLEVDPVTGGAITLTVPGGQTGGGACFDPSGENSSLTVTRSSLECTIDHFIQRHSIRQRTDSRYGQRCIGDYSRFLHVLK